MKVGKYNFDEIVLVISRTKTNFKLYFYNVSISGMFKNLQSKLKSKDTKCKKFFVTLFTLGKGCRWIKNIDQKFRSKI